mmetsp:Transcript_68248/g.159992  ORF Transcript_68248/g.159992 Transcript_68248/m.159992 type:complete len:108 (-) Transcript_68248:426-749(-)
MYTRSTHGKACIEAFYDLGSLRRVRLKSPMLMWHPLGKIQARGALVDAVCQTLEVGVVLTHWLKEFNASSRSTFTSSTSARMQVGSDIVSKSPRSLACHSSTENRAK